VTTAVDGEPLETGRGYVAPADRHLIVLDRRIRLGRGPRENLARPAIDPLLRSVGLSYGSRAVGVVVTGRLNDGAAGLADLKRCGGTTIVQGPRDAEAPDMPLSALRTSDIDYRAPLAELSEALRGVLSREPHPSPPVPDDVRLEVEIALGRPVGANDIERIADPAPFSCPACGGVLSEVRRAPPLRYRCQVGHAYTAECLTEEEEAATDEAMRIALRIIEERANLTGRMADEASRLGGHLSAREWESRASDTRRQVEVLRKALARS